MKVIIPEPETNCIQLHELHKGQLILGYLNNKPFCYIAQNGDCDYFAAGNADYDDTLTDFHPCISDVIMELVSIYPRITFEAYE